MTSSNLENWAWIGKLKKERVSQAEFDGLLSRAGWLADAHTFAFPAKPIDLADNALHALALAALRWDGYRSETRYLVF